MFTSSLLSLFQANRSRELGATVYCVGVKDFNETQVNKCSLCLLGYLAQAFGTGTKSRLTFSFLTPVYPKCVGHVADFKPLLPSPPSVEEYPSARVPERLLGKSREKAEEHQIHLLQAVGRRLCGLCCLVCEIKVQKDELCGNIAVLCKKKKSSLVTLIFYCVFPLTWQNNF